MPLVRGMASAPEFQVLQFHRRLGWVLEPKNPDLRISQCCGWGEHSNHLVEHSYFTDEKTVAQRLDWDLGASYIGLVWNPSLLPYAGFFLSTSISSCTILSCPHHPPACLCMISCMFQGLGCGVKKELTIRDRVSTRNQWSLEETLWAAGAQRWLGEIKVEVFTWLTLSLASFPQMTRWQQSTGMPKISTQSSTSAPCPLWFGSKNKSFGVRLCSWLAVGPWTIYFSSLGLHFLISTMDHKAVCEK